jgi:sec-independent protein translocase protein TatC
MNIGGREMHFLEHLEELRQVILHSLIAVALGTGFGWWLAPRVLERIIHGTVGHAVVLSPMESFNEHVRLAIILGLGVALPYVLYRIWNFVVPGLLGKEKSVVAPLVVASLVLFLMGAAFAYFLVIPAMIKVLLAFQTPSMQQLLQLSEVLKFVYNMILACGILFQLPLVTLILAWIGVVTPSFLLRKWRHAIVVVLFITAIITPGDVASAQIFMGLPIIALYFLSIGVAALVKRKPREVADGGA